MRIQRILKQKSMSVSLFYILVVNSIIFDIVIINV